MSSGNKILLLLPTRGRPENVERFYKSWKENSSGLNDVWVMIDLDDSSYNSKNKYLGRIGDDFKVCANERMNLVQKLNYGFGKYGKNYDIIGFVGDDTVIETKNWDQKIVEKFKGLGKYGMLYPNDGINKHNVPNHIFVTRQWCEKMGWFVYPKLTHLYIDKVWQVIGNQMNQMGISKYYHAMDIVIRHLHFAFDEKVVKDEIYKEIYNGKDNGTIVYKQYMKEKLYLKDLNKFL